MNVRKIDKNRYIELFEKKLDKNNFDSFIDQFEYIDNLILPFIGDDDFREKQEDAIINFYIYFKDNYAKNTELLDHMSKWIATIFPSILIIGESFLLDKMSEEEKEKIKKDLGDFELKPWNYLINMFKENLENTKEGIVSRLSYVNAFIINVIGDDDIDCSPVMDEYKDCVIFFYYWFKIKFFEDVLDALRVNFVKEDSIFIFDLAEAMIGGEFDPEELQDARYKDMLKKSYGKLSFTQKKNVETLFNYICDIKTDKSILFLGTNAEYAPLLHIPYDIDDEDLAELKRNLRGELSIMMNNEEAMIFSYYNEDSEKIIFNGFICEDETIKDMEEEFLEGIVLDSGMLGDIFIDEDFDDIENEDLEDLDEEDDEDFDFDGDYSCEESNLTFL